MPARRWPSGEHGDDPGRAHDPGALDRRPGAGERDVQRDGAQDEHEAQRDAEPEPRGNAEHERRQKHHVLAAGGDEMGKPGGSELGARAIVERAVVAEGHAPKQRALGRRHPRAQDGLRSRPHAVHEAGEAAPDRAGVAERVSSELGMDAADALPRLPRGQRLEPATDVEDRPDALGRPAHAASRAQENPLAGEAHHRHARAERLAAWCLEEDHAPVDGMAETRREPRCVDRVQPSLGEQDPGEDGDRQRHAHRDPRGEGRRKARGRHRGRRRDRAGHEAQRDGRRPDVPRPRPELGQRHARAGHSCTFVRNAARRLGPMPGTSPRSSIDLNPPCWRR